MFSDTLQHTHNGIDAPRLEPKNFRGFPIYESDAFDFTAPEGTIVIRQTTLGAYYLAVFAGGIWRETELTSIAS